MNLEKEGIDTRHVELITNQRTGIAQINVAENGDNQIVIVTGANQLLEPKDIHAAKDLIGHSRVLVCQLETPIPATIEVLKRFRGISILNVAPGSANLSKELLQLPSIVCLNELEAFLVTGVEIKTLAHSKEALLLLLSMGCKAVIITLGAQGAVYASKTEPKPIHVESPTIKQVIDTTGAGDAFIGALADCLAKNLDIPIYEKIGRACNIAALTVTKAGTQSSFPLLAELNSEEVGNVKWKFL